MKVIPIALQADYDSGCTTMAYAMRITRTDNRVYGFTSHDKDSRVAGVLYDSSQGLDVSSIATTAALGVDNLELTTLDDGSLFTREEVLGRIWQNAAFVIFRYNWAAPGHGVEYLLAGTIGNVTLRRGSVVCELRGLQQYLQQPVGSVTSKTCRARFADFPTPNGNNRCRLLAENWTDPVHVTAVTDGRRFAAVVDAGATRADGWYDEGVITWTDGANAGLLCRVKFFGVTPDAFELYADTAYPIEIGDHFTALAGCRKRLLDDCRDRFNNLPNFQGEPHMPGIDVLTSPPENHS